MGEKHFEVLDSLIGKIGRRYRYPLCGLAVALFLLLVLLAEAHCGFF